eukprot:TRINITY_DN4654_c0_g3_i1.p2 TRINITY_DN4654_c0_g3~~TRINITY_DN4654_c0_g3_i1.p2  ORF type:complete len:117 (+),score=30.77 TRINITY_DN4654_c0_g3_i1:256-606(+)
MSHHDPNRVIAGYKAALHNPNVSLDAKIHAQKMIDELQQEAIDLEGKDIGHVIGGYKATLHNPNMSIAAKKHALEMLERLDTLHYVEKNRSDSDYMDEEVDLQGKDVGHVIGGYKV